MEKEKITYDKLINTSITKDDFMEIEKDFIRILTENNMTYKSPIQWDRYCLNSFKLESTNEIIGFTLMEKRFPLNLSKFAIAKKYQGLGVGKVMLKLWEDYNNEIFNGLNVYNYMIHLECDNDTVGFYEKQGYSKYGSFKREENGEILERIFMNKQVFLK